MRITVVGLGYVGLVTSACLAEWGNEVQGIEADEVRLRDLQSARLPFHEPGLETLVRRHLTNGDLRVAPPPQMPGAVAQADLVIIAVGTHDGEGGWQTQTVRAALADVVPHLRPSTPLVVRSTCPPEFIAQLPDLVGDLRAAATLDIPILLNPEFTQEGRAVADFMSPSRVVCGVAHDTDGIGVDRLRALYGPVRAPFVTMSAIDASFAKLASNLFLATKISFANELARLCDAYGARVDNVVDAMAFDPRIGRAFLGAGIGFGGSCLPHQVTMTVQAARVAGLPTPLLAAVDNINDAQPAHLVGRLEQLLDGGMAGARVALLGLTFKPNTDDLRDAPALAVARLILERGASVCAYDPMATARQRAASAISGLEVVDDVSAALIAADAVVLATEWDEFRRLNWASVAQSMRRLNVVDGRNALDPDAVVAAGFRYTGFGRGWASPEPELLMPVETAAEVA